MNTVDKKAFISDLYHRTETVLEKAIKQYQNLDESSLNLSIVKESWSIAEVISHLNSYGNYYLPKIEAVLAESNECCALAYSPSWLGAYFINMMDVNKGKWRYKAAKQHQPAVKDAYAEVAEFISQQERLLKCIKASEQVDISRVRIPISISKFIKLNLGDLLSFLVMHNERHVVQIKKIQQKQAAALAERAVFATFAS